MNNMPDNKLMRPLPSPFEERNGQYLPVPAGVFNAPNYAEMEPEQTNIPISHYLWILRRQWWKVLTFVAIAAVSTLVVSKRLTPVYESTATVDVDRQMPSGIIGEEANKSTANDADQFLATQVKLIQSDSVLRPVADQFNLRVELKPDATASASRSEAAHDAPVILKQLKVTRPPNTYLLLIAYRSTNPQLAADVANGVTNSYLDHTYRIRFQSSAKLASFMEQQIDKLKAKMERSGAALVQFEKELNVINPEEKTSILSSRLLQLNTEYTNAQTERVRKETAFLSVNSGTMEAAQVSTQGESLKALAQRMDEAQQKLADVKTDRKSTRLNSSHLGIS